MLHNHDILSYTIHYKSHNNVVYSGKYHTESHAELLRLEVMPDHVHLLVEVDPQYGIHRLVRASKGRSSRLLRQEYPWLKSRLPTLWTNSYFVSTVGGAPLAVIKQYSENQKRVEDDPKATPASSQPLASTPAQYLALSTDRRRELGHP